MNIFPDSAASDWFHIGSMVGIFIGIAIGAVVTNWRRDKSDILSRPLYDEGRVSVANPGDTVILLIDGDHYNEKFDKRLIKSLTPLVKHGIHAHVFSDSMISKVIITIPNGNSTELFPDSQSSDTGRPDPFPVSHIEINDTVGNNR